MKLEQRFDFGGFRAKPTRTPQGFLKISGNTTRTGVLIYRRADGSEFRELRLAEEVFDPASLESMRGAPVTDLHPRSLVSPSNVTSLQKGFVGSKAKQDGIFVTATLTVQDAALIAAVERRERRELSPGYTCRVELKQGVHNGERYDGIQRGIVYNHLAIGPAGWARSGPEVALHIDGQEELEGFAAEVPHARPSLGEFVDVLLARRQDSREALAHHLHLDAFELDALLGGYTTTPITEATLEPVAKFIKEPVERLFGFVPLANRGDGKKTPLRSVRKMENVTVRIDGISYEVPAVVGPHVEKAISTRDANITALQAKADSATAAADVATKSASELQAKLDAATAPEFIAALVAERAALESKASAVLGGEVKLDGKSAREVKVLAIVHTDAAFDAEGKSNDYINARFDLIDTAKVTTARNDGKKTEVANALVGNDGGKTEEEVDRYDSAAARERMKKRNQEAWKAPLAASSKN